MYRAFDENVNDAVGCSGFQQMNGFNVEIGSNRIIRRVHKRQLFIFWAIPCLLGFKVTIKVLKVTKPFSFLDNIQKGYTKAESNMCQ